MRALGGVRMGWAVLLACWTAAAAVSLALGRDANHDLRNYHYYNAFALIEGRWGTDLAAAGPHTFLNPALDVPFYLLTRSPLNGWPRAVAVLQAGYAGALAFLVLAVCNLACHGRAGRVTAGSGAVALFGLTGVATLPAVGSTSNDIQVAVLVVGALLCLLLAPGARRAGWLCLGAGVLGGAAVGLKLTAVAYPPALLAAACLSGRGRWLRAVALLGLGGALGFAAAYGPWGWFLHQRYGSPFGPFFNDVFRSPWFTMEPLRDTRFLPAGVVQALLYPLSWAGTALPTIAEPPLSDPRFTLGLGAAGITAALGLRQGAGPGTVTRMVLGFVAAGYVAWLLCFSYVRYAVPMEALLGVPAWAAARAVLRTRRGAGACVATLLCACLLTTRYPVWRHEPFEWAGEPAGAAAVAGTPLALPPGSLVVMVANQVSFVAPFLHAPGIRFVGATRWTANGDAYGVRAWSGEGGPGRHGLAQETERLLRTAAGPVFAVMESPVMMAECPCLDVDVVQAFRIRFDVSSCRPVRTNLTQWVHICPVLPAEW